MSYDFHILTSERPLLINHKITPLVLTADGRAWLALCTVSLSSHKEAGQIRFRILGQSGYRQYSLTAHRWQPCEGVTLTPEEKQVLTLSAQGYTMKEISDHICRSFDTVKFYRRQLFEKLDVANITEAIAFCHQLRPFIKEKDRVVLSKKITPDSLNCFRDYQELTLQR